MTQSYNQRLLETEADAAKPQQCSWSRYWAWLTGIALILGTLVVFQAFQSLGTEARGAFSAFFEWVLSITFVAHS